jgi:Protein of unknown function (DUF3500)
MKTLAVLILFLNLNLIAQTAKVPDPLAAVNNLLKTLDKDQLQKINQPIDMDERRTWYYIPISRCGLMLKEMTEAQRAAAMDLLKATLSEQGSQKAIAIMQLEIILKELEKSPPENERRDPLKYYFSVFGKPSLTTVWGWRIEGHHVSLNFTSNGKKVVSGTPLFMGTNPGIVPSGDHKGYQIQKDEANLAFELLNSFDADQLKKAIYSTTAPNDMLTENSKKVGLLKDEGISFNELNGDQQKLLMRLIGVYVKNYPYGFAEEFMQKIEKAGLDRIKFAWSGDKVYGGIGHYYRIQNDVLLIEYDNVQNQANHLHTVVRDLTNDFGEDILRSHYLKDHAAKKK